MMTSEEFQSNEMLRRMAGLKGESSYASRPWGNRRERDLPCFQVFVVSFEDLRQITGFKVNLKFTISNLL